MLLRMYAERSNNVVFIDVEKIVLRQGRQARAATLFREDGVHLTPEGYKLYTAVAAPAFELRTPGGTMLQRSRNRWGRCLDRASAVAYAGQRRDDRARRKSPPTSPDVSSTTAVACCRESR